MELPVLYIFAALVAGLLTYLLQKRAFLKKKLWWLPQVPGYPLLGNVFEFGDSTKSLQAFHKYSTKYKGLYFIELLGKPFIIISDYKFTEWLLSSNTLLTKGNDYQKLVNWLGHGILIADGARWKKGRKIMTPAFHFRILEQFPEAFEEPTAVLLDLLNREANKESVDVYPFIAKYALDIICRTSLGVSQDAQKNAHSDYHEAVAGMCQILIERVFNPLKIADLLYRFSSDYTREKKYVKLLHEVSNKVIEMRRRQIENTQEKEDDKSDGTETKGKMAFLDILLKYRDENGQPLDDEFIRNEVDTFMFAGHDTVTSAISFALYCLANHPEIQAKALSEVQEVVGTEDRITFRNLQDMKYLELVIKESLRLYPSVPIYTRFTTEEVVYEEGKVIPTNVTLAISAYSISRDPKVFVNPEEFIPTRFLEADIKPFSYVPFSVGPRNCIGQKFAMMEMKYVLGKILLNFELLSAVPEHKLLLAAETVLKSKNGIKIKIKKRL